MANETYEQRTVLFFVFSQYQSRVLFFKCTWHCNQHWSIRKRPRVDRPRQLLDLFVLFFYWFNGPKLKKTSQTKPIQIWPNLTEPNQTNIYYFHHFPSLTIGFRDQLANSGHRSITFSTKRKATKKKTQGLSTQFYPSGWVNLIIGSNFKHWTKVISRGQTSASSAFEN